MSIWQVYFIYVSFKIRTTVRVTMEESSGQFSKWISLCGRKNTNRKILLSVFFTQMHNVHQVYFSVCLTSFYPFACSLLFGVVYRVCQNSNGIAIPFTVAFPMLSVEMSLRILRGVFVFGSDVSQRLLLNALTCLKTSCITGQMKFGGSGTKRQFSKGVRGCLPSWCVGQA